MPPGLSTALLSLLRPIQTHATYQKTTSTIVAIAKMATFNLPKTNPACPVRLTENITQDQLLSYPAFKIWHKTVTHSLSLQTKPDHEFNKSPYKLRGITVQSVDWFGSGEKKRLGFVKFQAQITNDNGEHLPGAVFMRGSSVAMLLVLQPDDVNEDDESEKHVLLTIQPRLAAGSLAFAEIPAGMLDDAGSFSGGAAKEIEEETGLVVKDEDLIDLTALALRDEENAEKLQKGVFTTPGACDEFVPIFLYQKRLPRKELDKFRGKLTGLRDESEKITLKVVKLEDLWKEGARDAKTLSAWALYQGLKKEGKI
jgi:ADP-sugar diphosphatase